jgi:hypothetical protein
MAKRSKLQDVDSGHDRRDPARKLSTAEIVRLTKLSPQRVRQRRARGETGEEIVAAVELRKGAEQAAIDEEKLHRSRTSSAAPPAPLSYSTRRKAEADAALRQIELAQRRGELVPSAQVHLYVGGVFVAVRQSFEHLEEDLATLIEREDARDPVTLRAVLRREIVRSLHALERHAETLGRAVAGAPGPINASLPPAVQEAILTIAKYSCMGRAGGE